MKRRKKTTADLLREQLAQKGNGQPNHPEPEPPPDGHGDAWEGHDDGAPTQTPGEPMSNADRELPVIDAGIEDLAVVTAQAWGAVQAANAPPTIFRYGALPSRIEADDEGMPMIRNLTVDRMRHLLGRVARWEKARSVRKGRKSETVTVAALPPLSIVRDVLATPDPPLPILTRIVEAPVFAADGSLQLEPGYSPATRTYYEPARGFQVPAILPCPGNAAVEAAKALICDELLRDFPFAGEAELAHAVAALILPFVRDLIDGPTPLHLFEAPSPGTGKTLLVELLTFPALGRPLSAMTEGKDEDEWRKRIFAKLRSGPSVLLIDNLKRRLDSGAVASALTAWPLWEDRILGVSETARVPARCLWMATGNNPALSSEIARRTIRCRLDAKVDRPWLRDGFRHPDIRRWANVHRGELVAAVLTLVQAWLAAGRPEGTRTLGMYEHWTRVIGGILDVARIPGFLRNLEEFYERADMDGTSLADFIAAWWDAHGNHERKVSELHGIALESGIDLGEKSEQSQKVRLGKLLREMRDRVFSVGKDGRELRLRLEAAGEFRRAKLWQLREVV